MKYKYHYKVIKSESPTMQTDFEFVTDNKLHDDRRKDKTVKLSDVECNDYFLQLQKVYTDKEWIEYKRSN